MEIKTKSMYYYSKLRWLLSFAVLLVFTTAYAQENDLLEELDSLSKEEVVLKIQLLKLYKLAIYNLPSWLVKKIFIWLLHIDLDL